MDDELTPEQRFAADDAETLVPRALLLGRTPDEVVADLVKLDWSPAAARAFVKRVLNDMRQFNESPESRQRLIDSSFKQFVAGSIAALAAGVLTALALGLAVVGGWPLAVVAVVFLGGSLTVAARGWARWRLYRGWARHLETRADAQSNEQ
jgi:hypothetical protein